LKQSINPAFNQTVYEQPNNHLESKQKVLKEVVKATEGGIGTEWEKSSYNSKVKSKSLMKGIYLVFRVANQAAAMQ